MDTAGQLIANVASANEAFLQVELFAGPRPPAIGPETVLLVVQTFLTFLSAGSRDIPARVWRPGDRNVCATVVMPQSASDNRRPRASCSVPMPAKVSLGRTIRAHTGRC